ncbi:MAG: Hint domain-containing protein [Pseudotabrizicola sp.]|uniref:Hint domain-containing protein n=1 Tax=Pseudotabrizicola sp. TaxID=2939647 RepID=UPI00272654BB|nr:Hint domain-containing protein [Pseudotabrizicola sp.]MDO9640277.1 Hint domain-containing protein [Pseudotabrizicola sp.]
MKDTGLITASATGADPTGTESTAAARRRGFAPARHPAYRSLVAGTQVRTPDGPMLVEDLVPGDLVLTADHGPRPLRRSLRRRIGGRGPAAPVLITAGTFGTSRDLHLSQDQRIVLSDPRATAPFGGAQVLAEARHLLNGTTVRLSPCAGVDYIQLIFDRAELIFAEDMLTETATAETHPKGPALRPVATAADLAAMMPALIHPPALCDIIPAGSPMAAPRVRHAAAKPQNPV